MQMGFTYLVAHEGLEHRWRDVLTTSGLLVTPDLRTLQERAKDLEAEDLFRTLDIRASLENRAAVVCAKGAARCCVSCTYDSDIRRYAISISYFSRKDASNERNRELVVWIDQLLRGNGAVDFDPSE